MTSSLSEDFILLSIGSELRLNRSIILCFFFNEHFHVTWVMIRSFHILKILINLQEKTKSQVDTSRNRSPQCLLTRLLKDVLSRVQLLPRLADVKIVSSDSNLFN